MAPLNRAGLDQPHKPAGQLAAFNATADLAVADCGSGHAPRDTPNPVTTHDMHLREYQVVDTGAIEMAEQAHYVFIGTIDIQSGYPPLTTVKTPRERR